MSTGRRQEAPRVESRASLRPAALLVLGGQLLYILVTQFHTGGEANDHPSIFASYADSGAWKGVHVGQFVAMGVIIAGLIGLHAALESRTGRGIALTARIGAVFAVAALTLYAALQAVDGVGNQQVDQAWVNAPLSDKAARFATAEAMRWLEWGVRSYHDYALGISLLLLAIATAAGLAVVVPRAVAVLMGLSGVAYLMQGWVVGRQGFSGANTIMILVAWALSLAWMIWLVIASWRPTRGTEHSQRAS